MQYRCFLCHFRQKKGALHLPPMLYNMINLRRYTAETPYLQQFLFYERMKECGKYEWNQSV